MTCGAKVLARDQTDGPVPPNVAAEPQQAPNKFIPRLVVSIYQIMKAYPGWNSEQVTDMILLQINQGILILDIGDSEIAPTKEKEVEIAEKGETGDIEVSHMAVDPDSLPSYEQSKRDQLSPTVGPSVGGSQGSEGLITEFPAFFMPSQSGSQQHPSPNFFENTTPDITSSQHAHAVHSSTGFLRPARGPSNTPRSRGIGLQSPPHVTQSSILGLPRTPGLSPEDIHVILLINITNTQ